MFRLQNTASMRAPPRPARVDFTPVMFNTFRSAARQAGKSSSAQKLKQGAKNLLRDAAEGIAEKQTKKEGNRMWREAKRQAMQAGTPERKTPTRNGNAMSPPSKSPIRTPGKHSREQHKLLLLQEQRVRRRRQDTLTKRLEDLQMSPSDK